MTFILIFTLMAFTAGCSGAGPAAVTMTSQAASAAGAEATTAKDMTIGAIIMNTSGEWFAEVIAGMEKAGRDLGVKVQIVSSENDVATEADNMDAFIAQKVDAIAMGPISADGSVAAYDRAIDAGIPVVQWNTFCNSTNPKYFVGVDNRELGKKTGEYLTQYVKQNYPDGASIALLISNRYQAGIERTEGFKEGVKELVDSGKIKIVTEVEAEFKEEGLDAVDRIVSGFPETQLIWAWNQTSMEGAIAGLTGNTRIKVMGTDMAISFAKAMLEKDSVLQAVTTQQPFEIGYTAIKNAVEMAKTGKADQSVLVPLQTYTRDDPVALQKYIDDRADLKIN
jgi:ABC-type sugar transport system substrate-binding protein